MRFEENKCVCLYTYAYLRMSSPFAVKSCPQRQIKLLSTVLFTSVGGGSQARWEMQWEEDRARQFKIIQSRDSKLKLLDPPASINYSTITVCLVSLLYLLRERSIFGEHLTYPVTKKREG